MPGPSDEQLEVGVPRIDDERRELQQQLAALSAAIDASRFEAAVRVLRALAASLTAHFGDEERWMRAEGYPDADAHVRAHAAGLECFQAAVAAFERNGVAARFLVQRAAGWLDLHLRRDDLRFGRYLVEQRATPPNLPRGG